MSKQAYDDHVESTYVEPGRDVAPWDGDRNIRQQIAELTDAVDRLQRRVEELERREPW